jgi:hypothetical protein
VKGGEAEYTFVDLLENLHKQEMMESLSVHQTFLCVLHLANQFQLTLLAPEESNFQMFVDTLQR